jgi:hypothetical protein
MIEVHREVLGDPLPFFIRDIFGDSREGFVKGRSRRVVS